MPQPPAANDREIPPCGCLEPGSASASTCYCGVDNLLRIIRRRYSLAVMNAIHLRSTARYNDLATAMRGISTSTLAETLHVLEVAGLVVRSRRDDATPAPYTLTASGKKLVMRLRGLLDDLDGSANRA